MGNACKPGFSEEVRSQANYDDDANVGLKYVLICALDYKKTNMPLKSTMLADSIRSLAWSCDKVDVMWMYDDTCVAELVKTKIREMADRCNEEDYFIFYFSGHGTNVYELTGEEADMNDEALCFYNTEGEVTPNSVMIDDDFAEVFASSLFRETRTLILMDTCHVGPIIDLSKPAWAKHKTIAITGCLQKETAHELDRCGILTHSMLLAISKLNRAGEHDYSVGLMYNAILEESGEIFSSSQAISIQSTPLIQPCEMAWPLAPKTEYLAPMHKAVKMVISGHLERGPTELLVNRARQQPQTLLQVGVAPELLTFLGDEIDTEGSLDYITQLEKGSCPFQ